MKDNSKLALSSFIITGLLYYFYLKDFLNLVVSKSIDIHMILFIVFTFYVYLVHIFIVHRKIDQKNKYVFMFLYIIMLVTLYFSKDISTQIGYVNTFNLDVLEIKRSTTNIHSIIVLVMNVLLIIPLGWVMRKTSTIYRLTFPVGLFLLVEYIQYINSIGVFDINDIILNTIGFYIGCFVLKFIFRR